MEEKYFLDAFEQITKVINLSALFFPWLKFTINGNRQYAYSNIVKLLLKFIVSFNKSTTVRVKQVINHYQTDCSGTSSLSPVNVPRFGDKVFRRRERKKMQFKKAQCTRFRGQPRRSRPKLTKTKLRKENLIYFQFLKKRKFGKEQTQSKIFRLIYRSDHFISWVAQCICIPFSLPPVNVPRFGEKE